MSRLAIPTFILAAAVSTAALAQAPTPQPAQPKPAPPAASQAATLEPGANSFTESQAAQRIGDAGFGKVTGLKKDDQGVWRGKAEKDGKSVDVGLDYRGNVVAK